MGQTEVWPQHLSREFFYWVPRPQDTFDVDYGATLTLPADTDPADIFCFIGTAGGAGGCLGMGGGGAGSTCFAAATNLGPSEPYTFVQGRRGAGAWAASSGHTDGGDTTLTIKGQVILAAQRGWIATSVIGGRGGDPTGTAGWDPGLLSASMPIGGGDGAPDGPNGAAGGSSFWGGGQVRSAGNAGYGAGGGSDKIGISGQFTPNGYHGTRGVLCFLRIRRTLGVSLTQGQMDTIAAAAAALISAALSPAQIAQALEAFAGSGLSTAQVNQVLGAASTKLVS